MNCNLYSGFHVTDYWNIDIMKGKYFFSLRFSNLFICFIHWTAVMLGLYIQVFQSNTWTPLLILSVYFAQLLSGMDVNEQTPVVKQHEKQSHTYSHKHTGKHAHTNTHSLSPSSKSTHKASPMPCCGTETETTCLES